MFARLNLNNVAALNCCQPLRLPLEGAVRRTDGILLKNKYSALRHTSSVSQARHLLLKEKANLTSACIPRQKEALVVVSAVISSGRTQFAPNDIQFTLLFFCGTPYRRIKFSVGLSTKKRRGDPAAAVIFSLSSLLHPLPAPPR